GGVLRDDHALTSGLARNPNTPQRHTLSQVCPELFFHRTWRGPATLCESEKLPALCSRHRSEPPQNASKIQIRSSGFSPTRDFVAARGLARQESLIRYAAATISSNVSLAANDRRTLSSREGPELGRNVPFQVRIRARRGMTRFYSRTIAGRLRSLPAVLLRERPIPPRP